MTAVNSTWRANQQYYQCDGPDCDKLYVLASIDLAKKEWFIIAELDRDPDFCSPECMEKWGRIQDNDPGT